MADKDPSRSTSLGSESVQLREFEQRLQEIKDLIDLRVTQEREMREASQTSIAQANTLALREIERRLGELNHAHAQAMENWARTLPRELFESWQKEYDRWKAEVSMILTTQAPQAGDLKALEARVSVQSAQSAAFSTAMTTMESMRTKVDAFEKMSNRLQGAFYLLTIGGVAGILALIMGLLRTAGVMTK